MRPGPNRYVYWKEFWFRHRPSAAEHDVKARHLQKLRQARLQSVPLIARSGRVRAPTIWAGALHQQCPQPPASLRHSPRERTHTQLKRVRVPCSQR